jgi:hypothetical protein
VTITHVVPTQIAYLDMDVSETIVRGLLNWPLAVNNSLTTVEAQNVVRARLYLNIGIQLRLPTQTIPIVVF